MSLTRLLKDVTLNQTTLGPTASVSEALGAMERGDVRAVAILSGDLVLGVLSLEAAVLSDPDSPVSDSMRGALPPLSALDPVRSVAKSFIEHQTEHMPVMQGDKYLGLISSFTLLSELGRSWDPLTGLSWSDRVREWGMENLAADREISIIFFDLDDFGQYNKVHGHIVGDQVLTAFTQKVSAVIDSKTDVFVRHGGDEFVIGTLRLRDELDGLLLPLSDRVIHVDGLEESARYSYGVSGGNRKSAPVRGNENLPAILDNLINLASRASTESKPKNKHKLKPSQESAHTIPLFDRIRVEENPLREAGNPFDQRVNEIIEASAKALELGQPGIKLCIDDVVFSLEGSGYPSLTIFAEVWQDGRVTPLITRCSHQEEINQKMSKALGDLMTAGNGRRV